MSYIDVTGKTEDEAIRKALEQLHMDRDDVSVEILERAKSGFLGIGSSPARVRVTYGQEEPEAPAAPVQPEKKPEPRPQPRPQPKPEQPKTRKPEPPKAPVKAPEPPKAAQAPAAAPEQSVLDDNARRITEFLTGLLEHMDSPAQVQVTETEKGRYSVVLEGQKLGQLIGRRGETLDAIQMAKLRGAPVTCEVTPHHLWFTNDTCDYRVNPPIRTADDVQALVDGIRTGIVDAIATDHAPHSEEDKLKGMAGMVGSETAFGVCYTKLCKQEGLPLEVLVHLMSTRPAEILGLAKGQLEPGYDADMVLVDLDTPYTVDKDKLHSKSHNTPFDGAELYGKVCATIKGGKLTYQAED